MRERSRRITPRRPFPPKCRCGMADNPISTPPAPSHPLAARPPAHGIQPAANGATATAFTPEGPAPGMAPSATSHTAPLVEHLKNIGLQTAVLAVIWLGAFVLLLALGQRTAEAVG